MIKDRKEIHLGPIKIDLSAPEGNAFRLIAIATQIAKALKREGVDKDMTKIRNEMMSGDYNNLLDVMEREFGDFIIMYK